MKHRERILLIGTALAVSIYLADRVGGVDAITNLATMNSAQLEALRQQNSEYRQQIENVGHIQEEFNSIEALFDTGSEETEEGYSQFRFTEQIADIFEEFGKTGREAPSIKPPRREAIAEDVTEFQYIVVEVSAKDLTEANLRHLLRRLQEENILVQQLDINGVADQSIVNITMFVARIERVQPAAAPTAGLGI